MKDELCVLILSYRRAERVDTVKTLEKCGYTGPWYIVLSSDDPTIEKYKEKFGADKIVVFDKDPYKVDLLDNRFDKMAAVCFARNASYEIAKRLGYRYFIMLDDDYVNFFWTITPELKRSYRPIKNLDAVFEACLEYYKESGIDILGWDVTSILISQGPALLKRLYFGEGYFRKRMLMNFFLCDVTKPIEFKGRLREDMATSVYQGSRGKIFISIPLMSTHQRGFKKRSEGGLSDSYKERGWYLAGFETFLASPSSVRMQIMTRETDYHIGVMIDWSKTAPHILPSRYK